MFNAKQTNLVLCQTAENVFFSTSLENLEKMTQSTFDTIQSDMISENRHTTKENPIHVVLVDGEPFYM